MKFNKRLVSFCFTQWKVIHQEKPDASVNHLRDIVAIEEAKRTIGDYKLKTSLTFDSLSGERDTLLSKYKELFNCWKKVRIISSNLTKKEKTTTPLLMPISLLILFLH